MPFLLSAVVPPPTNKGAYFLWEQGLCSSRTSPEFPNWASAFCRLLQKPVELNVVGLTPQYSDYHHTLTSALFSPLPLPFLSLSNTHTGTVILCLLCKKGDQHSSRGPSRHGVFRHRHLLGNERMGSLSSLLAYPQAWLVHVSSEAFSLAQALGPVETLQALLHWQLESRKGMHSA